MRIDLLHNRVLAENMTPRFRESFESDLVPKLVESCDGISGVLMYEDYMSLDFMLDGEWYYPLTVFVGENVCTRWIKWIVDGNFRSGCPYAFVGTGGVEFSCPDTVPTEMTDALVGRAISYEEGSIGVRVVGASKDPSFLVGRYSQTFVDELARQITAELTRVLSVDGIGNGTLELQLVFAPDTYMEHTSENVTYRRLLLTDKGCQPRDFWVKWTRINADTGYSVKDSVSGESIRFELGEDVPQKIREKEYRFLCRANPDKYQSAMGKKTVTEWRELIKRSIKRGELIKLEAIPDKDDDLDARIRDVLGEYSAATVEPTPSVDDDDITRLAREALGIDAPVEENAVTDCDVTDEGYDFGLYTEEDAACDADGDNKSASYAEEANGDTETNEETVCEDEPDCAAVSGQINEPVSTERDDAELERLREERIRNEVEARLRLEYEAEARARAQTEERLRIEREQLREENERLREQARIREEQAKREEEARAIEEERRLEEQARRKEEEERTRARIAEQARLEEAERVRLAEIARRSIDEQNRLERERIEREEREKEERERIEAEAQRRERERLERERIAREEEERRRAQPTFITKHAKLIFRRSVDLSVINRIKEIVEQTLISNRKAHIHIYMKAYPIDAYTINLDMKLPDNEGELLVTIVKAIGNGHLGITKIIVE